MSTRKNNLLARARGAVVTRRVDALDDTLGFRKLTLRERDEYEARMFDPDTNRVLPATLIGVRAYLVAACVVDPDTHERLFTEDDVSGMDGDVGLALHDIAQEVNGMKRNAVADAAGKSPETGGDTSD